MIIISFMSGRAHFVIESSSESIFIWILSVCTYRTLYKCLWKSELKNEMISTFRYLSIFLIMLLNFKNNNIYL